MSDPQPTEQAKAALNEVTTQIGGLSRLDKFAFFGGLVYLVALFLPMYESNFKEYAQMYGIKLDATTASFNEIGGLLYLLALIVALLAITGPFADRLLKGRQLPFPKPLIYLVAGAAGVLLPLLEYLTSDGRKYINLAYGFWLLLAAGAVIAYSGFARGGLTQLQERLGQAGPQVVDQTKADDPHDAE